MPGGTNARNFILLKQKTAAKHDRRLLSLPDAHRIAKSIRGAVGDGRPRAAAAALELCALAHLGGLAVDLAQRRLEGVAQGQQQLLAGVAALALVADDDGLTARQADLNLDLEDLGLGRAAVRGFRSSSAN